MARNLRYVPAPRRYRPNANPFRRVYGIVALCLFVGVAAWPQFGNAVASLPLPLMGEAQTVHQNFSMCGSAKRVTCVVDGDTFWLAGEKIRIADIDTPEISSPQCGAEARLGNKAKARLQRLLNAGPFELRSGLRDEDRYGRKLRTVHRDGRSLGAVLVAEGLAHHWVGAKQSWCGNA